MAGFAVQGFNHTSFTVANLDRAIGFFRDFLGFELLSRAPRGQALIERMTAIRGTDVEIAFVRGPGHTIELIEYKAPADRTASGARLCDAGAAHIALDVDDVPAAVAGARVHGFDPIGEIIVIDDGPNRGRQVVYLKGPDNFVIEFIGLGSPGRGASLVRVPRRTMLGEGRLQGRGVVHYGAVAQAFHWLIAALIFAMLALGYYMEDLPLGTRKLELYAIHKSTGITIALLAGLRLAWRLLHPPPPLPASVKPWERKAARVVHALLYLMLFVQPLIGFLQSNAANFPVVLWGFVRLPPLIGPAEPLSETLIVVHSLGGNFLAILVIVHIAAALRHQFVLKDDVLRRMLPGPAAQP